MAMIMRLAKTAVLYVNIPLDFDDEASSIPAVAMTTTYIFI